MKKVDVLLVVSFIIEVEEDDFIKDTPDYMKTADRIMKFSEEKIEASTKLRGESSYGIILEGNNVNCGRCVICNRWVTDREKENHIPQLCNGATVNGQLLCDEHLPKGHKWAF